jgi:hypothetical protein
MGNKGKGTFCRKSGVRNDDQYHKPYKEGKSKTAKH